MIERVAEPLQNCKKRKLLIVNDLAPIKLGILAMALLTIANYAAICD